MKLNLNNKVTLVTGGSKGIGKHISLALKQEGANVYVLARPSSELEDLKKDRIKTIGCDFKNEEEIKRCMKTILQEEGRLDILINNIGGVENFNDFENLKDEDWLNAFEMNVLSAVRFIRNSLPLLMKSSSPRALNVSSVVSSSPGYFNPHYSSSKSALNNLTLHLAKKYAPKKILVNSILLGPILSDGFERNIQKNWDGNLDFDTYRKDFIKLEENKIPLKKLGDPVEIASLVAFLVSSNNNWMTGAFITIDGGKSI